MKVIYLCIMSLMFSCITSAQSIVLEGDGVLTVKTDSKTPKVVGSPYLNKEYTPAKVNEGTQNFSIRYNALKDVMEYDKDGVSLDLIKEKNTHFLFVQTAKCFVLKKYQNKRGVVEVGYLEQLAKTNNLTFYKRSRKKIKESKKLNNGYGSSSLNRIVNESDQFYIEHNNKISYVKKEKHLYKKIFSEYEDQIEDFIDENSTEFEDRKSMQLLLEFLEKTIQ